MTDLRELLHESAPRPTGPLDMAAVYRRGRQRRSRRLGGWLGLAGVTLGLGVPSGSMLVTAGEGGRDQAAATTTLPPTGAARAASETTTTLGLVAGPPIRSLTAGGGGAKTPIRTVDPLAPSAAPTSSGDPIAAPTSTAPPGATPTSGPAAPRPEYPRAASCSVDNAGLGPSEQRACRFTATAAGGASRRPYGDEVNSPHGQVLVTRNGTTTAHPVFGAEVFAGDVRRGCQELFIQPGDLVEVVLTNSPRGTTQVETIGAGEHWEC